MFHADGEPGGTRAVRSAAPRLRLVALATIAVLIGLSTRAWLVSAGANFAGDGAIRYEPLAQNLLDGRGFGLDDSAGWDPMCSQVPGYPALLAGLHAITGGSARAIVVTQFAVEAVILIVLWQLLASWGGPVVRVLAIGVALMCPVFAFFCRIVSPASVAALTLVGLIYLLVPKPASANRTVARYVIAGLIAGASMWVRVDCLPFIAIAPLVALWSSRTPLPVASKALLGYIATAVLIVTPWVVRNYTACRVVEVPGVAQFTQFGAGYWRWLDTWLDDPRQMDDFGYRVFHPDGPSAFPTNAGIDRAELKRADVLLARMQREAASAPSTAAAVNAEFLDMARGARSRRSLASRLGIRVRRTVLTWVRMPALGPSPPSRAWKAIWYVIWVAVLGAALLGVVVGLLKRDPGTTLLALLVASRTAMPFVSAAGAQTAYLAQAVPAVYALAAVGTWWTIASCSFQCQIASGSRVRQSRPA